MKLTRESRFVLLVLSLLTALNVGCSRPGERQTLTPLPPEAPASESYAAFAAENRQIPQRRLSRFFLVEQFSATYSSSLGEAFRLDPPGGIIFWNSTQVGWQELSATIARYSNILKSSGHLPALFSADYEGGGLNFAPFGGQVIGIQRFRKGFTDIAHGVWLGRSMAKFGTELCTLHGRIISKELVSVGLNYPLTLVSDLSQRLFALRGVSTDPVSVASCLSAFTQAMADAGPIVTVTKHFPGLGQNSGDTHDVESISTAKTEAESNRHLFPFRDLISYVNAHGIENRLSIMSSHGKFPLLDPNHLTTESPALLETILRDRFQFRGIRVSDAMWMGGYGSLQGDDLYAVYLNAFVSGLDLLMIPGGRYGGALRAFTLVAENGPTAGLRQAIERRTGQSFSDFRIRFLSRVDESLARLDFTLKSLPYPHEAMTGSVPSSLTTAERARYYEILRSLDSRWARELPARIL